MIHVVLFSFCKGQRLLIFLKENSIKSKKKLVQVLLLVFLRFSSCM